MPHLVSHMQCPGMQVHACLQTIKESCHCHTIVQDRRIRDLVLEFCEFHEQFNTHCATSTSSRPHRRCSGQSPCPKMRTELPRGSDTPAFWHPEAATAPLQLGPSASLTSLGPWTLSCSKGRQKGVQSVAVMPAELLSSKINVFRYLSATSLLTTAVPVSRC